MTEQLTLEGRTGDRAPKLTDRQRYALDLVAELGPVPSDELGAHMHERRGRHSSETRCTWCAQEGKGTGRELRTKGLVRMRHGEGWYVPGRKARRPVEGGYDPATEPIPF